jgi:hypothetical protein
MQHRSDAGRGQIIIVSALVMAAVLVGLALVLNSGIYAENLSSRETSDTDDALTFTVDAAEAVAEAYERTNANGSSTAEEARMTFNESVDDWAVARERRAANQGVSTDVERTASLGWRLEQSTDRSFTPSNDSNAAGWTVASGTSGVATARLNVTRGDLYDGTLGVTNIDDEAFHIDASNGTVDRQLYVFRDTGNSTVVVYTGDPDGFSELGDLLDAPESCARTTDRAVIDLQAETFEGTQCDALGFVSDLEGPIDIRYRNVRESTGGTERVNGTYELVVNGSTAVATDGSGHPEQFNRPSEPSPTATAVVYSASYTTHYAGTDLSQTRRGRHDVREETYAA